MRLALLTLGGLIADAAAADLVERLAPQIVLVARSDAAGRGGRVLSRAQRHHRHSGPRFLTYLTVAHGLGPLWPGPGGGRSRASLAAGCARHGVPLLPCPDVNALEFRSILARSGAELIVTACFDQILAPATIAAVPSGALNIHPAPLPGYRGPCPLIDMAVDGLTTGAVTLHRIDDAAIDAGAIVASRAVTFAADASILARERIAYRAGAALLTNLIADLPAHLAAARPQLPGPYRSFPDRQRLARLCSQGVALWRWSDLLPTR